MIESRGYSTGVKAQVSFFIGKEVECTDNFDRWTLFVVGLQSPRKVLDALDKANNYIQNVIGKDQKIEHILFGANGSFGMGLHYEWEELIRLFLHPRFNLVVSLDYDINYVPSVQKMGLHKESNFTSLISVKLPSVTELGNAYLKIDDIGFNKTNKGVWTHMVASLQTEETFTPWQHYLNDTPI